MGIPRQSRYVNRLKERATFGSLHSDLFYPYTSTAIGSSSAISITCGGPHGGSIWCRAVICPAVSALFAATHPERTLSLALLSPGGIYRYASPALDLIQGSENPLIARNRAEYARLMVLAMDHSPFIPWPIAGVLAEKAAADREIWEKIFAKIHGSDGYAFEATLQSSQAPALILRGTENRILDVQIFRSLIKVYPDKRLIVRHTGKLRDHPTQGPIDPPPGFSCQLCKIRG